MTLAALRRTVIPSPVRSRVRQARRGFSLLEVILALAIMTGALAILGEAARMAARNAEVARDLSHAQLLCESILGELTAEIISLEPVQNAAIDDEPVADEGWLYSIDIQPLDQEGLVAVTVTVTREAPVEKRPVEFSVVRWFLDPTWTQNLQQSSTDQSSDSSAQPSTQSSQSTPSGQ